MPNPPKVERKLAAIVFTDIAGFTEITANDQTQALDILNQQRKLLKPIVESYNGKWLKEIGDGLLLIFNTVTDAVNCSIDIQNKAKNIASLNLRIGIHQGEIVLQENDVIGDDVNIASRIEPFSAVGGIAISNKVNDAIIREKEFETEYIGKPKLKGVSQAVEVYCISSHGLPLTDISKVSAKLEKEKSKFNIFTLTGSIITIIGIAFWIFISIFDISFADINEVPAIAILPIENKGEPQDEFYAYGISSDLISDVTSAGLIRVASLKDIEKLEYLEMDTKVLSKKLFVRYVAQGTLWKMDSIFQLSMEIFDTKEDRVVYTKRWQTNWNKLTSIKGDLSDNILNTLKVEINQKQNEYIASIEPKAYEYYLKANYKYAKRENTEDVEIVRGLLRKAIELDGNLILAKILLGSTYTNMGDFDKAMQIFTSALKQSKSLGDEPIIALSLNNIGRIYFYKGDKENALDYFTQALNIYKKLDDKVSIGGILSNIGVIYNNTGEIDKAIDNFNQFLFIGNELNNKKIIEFCLNNIGTTYAVKGDCDMALEYFIRSLKINEESGEKFRSELNLNNIGIMYSAKGDYDKALVNLNRSLAINEDLGDKSGIGMNLVNIGNIYLYKGDYKKAVETLEKSLAIQKEIGVKVGQLRTTANLYLGYKHLGKDYDEKEIHSLIKEEETENIDFELNYRLYELLKEKSYLETAYNQIQEKVDAMDDELKEKFLSYPIPKKIIEEYNRVFS